MKEIKEDDQVIEVNDKMSIELKYADDTVLISCVFDRLKKSARQLKLATMTWGLKTMAAEAGSHLSVTEALK